MKWITTSLILLTVACSATPSDDSFTYWPAAGLRGYERSLAGKMSPEKVAAQVLGRFGSHSVMVLHREASGQSELHETQADVFVAQSGEGELLAGGAMVDGKTTAPNEIRGTGITGGTRKPLRPGDMAQIPPNTPHQVF